MHVPPKFFNLDSLHDRRFLLPSRNLLGLGAVLENSIAGCFAVGVRDCYAEIGGTLCLWWASRASGEFYQTLNYELSGRCSHLGVASNAGRRRIFRQDRCRELPDKEHCATQVQASRFSFQRKESSRPGTEPGYKITMGCDGASRGKGYAVFGEWSVRGGRC